jgi:hypothetical protein
VIPIAQSHPDHHSILDSDLDPENSVIAAPITRFASIIEQYDPILYFSKSSVISSVIFEISLEIFPISSN